MAVLFKDTFTGESSILAHTPDFGGTWVDAGSNAANLKVSGGSVMSVFTFPYGIATSGSVETSAAFGTVDGYYEVDYTPIINPYSFRTPGFSMRAEPSYLASPYTYVQVIMNVGDTYPSLTHGFNNGATTVYTQNNTIPRDISVGDRRIFRAEVADGVQYLKILDGITRAELYTYTGGSGQSLLGKKVLLVVREQAQINAFEMGTLEDAPRTEFWANFSGAAEY
jgi:hypothetical protein